MYDSADFKPPTQEAHMKKTFAAMALVVSIFVCLGNECAAQTKSAVLPNPVLYFLGQEPYSTGGNNFIRYRYGVMNSSSYPDTMFAAAPSLPPCGANTNSSRTWVDLFDQSGRRLYGFCALGKSESLNTIWFALPADTVPPSWIYVEMSDRQTATKYKSNLAETTL
jgi:hypothetical protein